MATKGRKPSVDVGTMSRRQIEELIAKCESELADRDIRSGEMHDKWHTKFERPRACGKRAKHRLQYYDTKPYEDRVLADIEFYTTLSPYDDERSYIELVETQRIKLRIEKGYDY